MAGSSRSTALALNGRLVALTCANSHCVTKVALEMLDKEALRCRVFGLVLLRSATWVSKGCGGAEGAASFEPPPRGEEGGLSNRYWRASSKSPPHLVSALTQASVGNPMLVKLLRSFGSKDVA